ncbi:MAG: hypothetical protein A3G02_01515 [Candidatus Yanofskybacteria bacterium RIFCSPLOWO2_12_FULL_44_13b]|uniref:Uncharacterized protein n=1 Tax=Candidatus Yanofskybacteria bacterium RIFCSPLOWO2_02_FULL_44_18 TaxID=1802705 RepID=A0A1F8H1J1_9BACT|nr:MAG: hypothetical protein A3F50_00730 [Candidatus Yanofskybacteria bacterium RIFCSPHIGHO2_12_FULL_44_29b]OGN31110.1 MAG: hypothetical protein A3I96_02325 [Candidatus Yanofskybacteria bacterium RIFCSPLOWO2_02_FULL_44_18]OGN35275.1 MAG: hypothetical protein A3G02_01515 [Candidatus Yanofskybacteria bacterium RIFCSPLOWO2_12_FULL_44_13b]
MAQATAINAEDSSQPSCCLSSLQLPVGAWGVKGTLRINMFASDTGVGLTLFVGCTEYAGDGEEDEMGSDNGISPISSAIVIKPITAAATTKADKIIIFRIIQ